MEKQSEVNRNCGIEMLKIISIFLIIISHVVMTIRLKINLYHMMIIFLTFLMYQRE